jgi:NAD(P)-dependent dehydrogenase (short-subunit alcohol dehydrogenase family)
VTRATQARFLPVDLAGARVVVTAGGAGIGRTIAAAFHARGAAVLVCDVSRAALDEVRQALPGVGAVEADVADPAAVAALFAAVQRGLGGLDVLVNNAGIAGPTARVEDVTPDDLQRTLAVNVEGQFNCARLAVPLLKAAGGGTILNLSSIAGRLGFPMRAPYAASKWAVIGFTKSLAIELGETGIRVNALLPGHVDSERFRRVVRAKAEATGRSVDDVRAQFLAPVSLKRNVSADDIANMALYLASPFGASITGQAISVCGDVQMMA